MRVAERGSEGFFWLSDHHAFGRYIKRPGTSSKKGKQISKQINKQPKKRGKKLRQPRTRRHSTVQRSQLRANPDPTPLPTPSRLSQLLSIFTPPSQHPSLSTYKHVHTLLHAHRHAIARTPTSAVGISPMEQLAEVQVVPGWLLSLCLAQRSPLPAQRPHPILPELPHLTAKELAEYPHYAASLRQQKERTEDDKKKHKQGG